MTPDAFNSGSFAMFYFSGRLQYNCLILTISARGDSVHHHSVNHIHQPQRYSHKYLHPHIQCTDYFPSFPNLQQHSSANTHSDCFASNQQDLLRVLLQWNYAAASHVISLIGSAHRAWKQHESTGNIYKAAQALLRHQISHTQAQTIRIRQTCFSLHQANASCGL